MTKSRELSPRWLLPGELADLDGTRRRRTVRDWLVDLALFAGAVFMGLVELGDPQVHADLSDNDWHMLADILIGAASCIALWWRRRIPLILVWLMLPAQLAWSASGAVFVAVLTAALHRPWRPVLLAIAAHLVLILPAVIYFDIGGEPIEVMLVAATLFYIVPMLWGMTMRSRRQLVLSVRREQKQQLNGARQAERRRIAREMHDTLAHRLSLLSVHAGALAYRTDTDPQNLTPSEVNAATQVIQDSAQRALSELGEVLTLLRSDDDEDALLDGEGSLPERVQALAAEARDAGQDVRLSIHGEPDALTKLGIRNQRTVYRVVQEGLTNARKHAPGRPVTVRVTATPAEVAVEVLNPLPTAPGRGDGFGLGLTGLHERVGLDGGSLTHDSQGGLFRLSARIPWSA